MAGESAGARSGESRMHETVKAGNDRRTKLVGQITARIGITEAMVADLVTTFYASVRQDPQRSPVSRVVR